VATTVTLAAELLLVTFPRVALFLSLLFLASCSDESNKPHAIGEAYVGPATLPLRQELAQKSPVSATVKHGDRLEILEYKRRFVKVRTAKGAEGWTDNRQLLTPEQMTALRQMADVASRYPSQGAATVFEPLNMHTEPSRTSPSFWQIPDNGKVDVIGHKLAPRVQSVRSTAEANSRPPAPRRRSKDRSAQSKIPSPPPPPAPKPPDNWLDLSVPNEEILGVEKKAGAPQPMDDWSLVRTKDDKVGWVLTRALNMAIPDEVAQYAEGHRITSYFALGGSNGVDRPDWLWTTITKGLEPYEFDSFRVFVWSKKHKRYETAYIERNVVGHFPVEVDSSSEVPRFSVILEDISGKLMRKSYTFEGYRVRMVAKAPYQAAASGTPPRKPATARPAGPPPKPRSWYASMKDRIRHLFH